MNNTGLTIPLFCPVTQYQANQWAGKPLQLGSKRQDRYSGRLHFKKFFPTNAISAIAQTAGLSCNLYFHTSSKFCHPFWVKNIVPSLKDVFKKFQFFFTKLFIDGDLFLQSSNDGEPGVLAEDHQEHWETEEK